MVLVKPATVIPVASYELSTLLPVAVTPPRTNRLMEKRELRELFRIFSYAVPISVEVELFYESLSKDQKKVADEIIKGVP